MLGEVKIVITLMQRGRSAWGVLRETSWMIGILLCMNIILQ